MYIFSSHPSGALCYSGKLRQLIRLLICEGMSSNIKRSIILCIFFKEINPFIQYIILNNFSVLYTSDKLHVHMLKWYVNILNGFTGTHECTLTENNLSIKEDIKKDEYIDIYKFIDLFKNITCSPYVGYISKYKNEDMSENIKRQKRQKREKKKYTDISYINEKNIYNEHKDLLYSECIVYLKNIICETIKLINLFYDNITYNTDNYINENLCISLTKILSMYNVVYVYVYVIYICYIYKL